MNKKMSKIVAIGCGVGIITANLIPVHADNNTSSINKVDNSILSDSNKRTSEKEILTAREAVSAALKNSEKLKMKSEEIKMLKEKLEVQDEIDRYSEGSNSFPYDQIGLLKNQSEQAKGFMEDQIANDITNKFNDLVSKENELDKIKNNLDIKTKEIKDMKLKKDLGLVTSLETESAELELQTLQNTQKAKLQELKDNQDYFKLLTNIDLNNYQLDKEYRFESFRVGGSVDSYMEGKVNEYLKYDQLILERTEESFYDDDENKVDLPDRPTRPVAPTKPEQGNLTDAEYDILMNKYKKDYEQYKIDVAEYNNERNTYALGLTTYANYLQQKYNTENSLVTLEDSKKALKKGLIDSYAQLLALEDTIQVTKKQLDLSEKQLKNTKLRYDLGLITLTDYKKQVVSNEDAKNSYDTLIVNYNSLKNGIEKPWILNTGK
ncbi:TolC family protein [Clostridioides difficile]|uniref:TolC family protein n=1 Tax=Clostridioides difficile TaxID=1496 RepID=UPI00098013C2|nr:TolC family protein [Clostridioides difficile]SJS77509.1 Outer membrane efflux protein [Clostridioides difficile]SJS82285.1 Outer membrane efflux protein [Clostridioides difficile]SJT16438.1 Outer membrane efflux protein [Clostridioides difficile]